MLTKIQKWGNSLGLRIPSAFVKEASLQAESIVELTFTDGQLVITPVSSPQYTLASLLADITPGNLHVEIDTGETQGREAW